jgi:small GTP-binding protein
MAVKNIGIFGKRNAGKSSLINLLVGQDVAIVSSIAGTTNDPVKKRIEIPGIGICTLIDTAGIDDAGDLGNLRIKKSLQIADQIDMAIVLYTANMFDKEEVSLMKLLAGREIPVLIIHNQSDIMPLNLKKAKLLSQRYGTPIIDFSCCEMNVEKQTEALEKLISAIKSKLESQTKTIMHGLVKENGVYLLICPIDEEAPKERLILPQVMAIRDILDNNATAVVLRPGQLSGYLKANLNGNVGEGAAEKSNNNQVENFSKIELIVTDSSVFGEVTKIIDSVCAQLNIDSKTLPLTSFSILLARIKGHYEDYLRGAAVIETLKPGDEVLIMESCTHHVRCADIGRVRLPAMLPKGLKYHFVSGLDEIPGLGEGEKIHYSLAIQCGGCMATAKQIHNRVQQVIEAGVPITNFGMAIAYVTDILKRVTII